MNDFYKTLLTRHFQLTLIRFSSIEYVPYASPSVGAGAVYEYVLIGESLDTFGVGAFLFVGTFPVKGLRKELPTSIELNPDYIK